MPNGDGIPYWPHPGTYVYPQQVHYPPVVEHHHWHCDHTDPSLKELLVTIQSDLDTQTSAIAAQTAILTDIKTAVDALKASNPSIDTSGLDAAVAGEGAAVTALQADVASTPAPVEQPPVDVPAVDAPPADTTPSV